MEDSGCFLSLLEQREIDNNSHGYFGASEATIFSKRGSLRNVQA